MPEGPRPSTRPLPLAEIARIAGATRTGTDAADPDPAVTGVTHDSRDVRPGDLYAALPGFRTHGSEFVVQAVELGAVAILTDPAGADRATATGAAVLVVEDPRSHLGAVASAVYGDPSHDLLVVGVTGTNGKTTTSFRRRARLPRRPTCTRSSPSCESGGLPR